MGAGWKHARGSGGHAERQLQCPVDCHTQGRDELFGDRRVGEFGTVYRVGDLIHGRPRPLVLIVDHAPFQGSQKVREWVRAHRSRLRIFFLPNRSPELNPDEQVGNEIKSNKIGKQPIKNKRDLKKRLYSALRSLEPV